MPTKFETKTCNRCGGSGNYSWNAMHGSRCYGCGGSGRIHSQRGYAARLYFMTISRMPAGDVEPGMLLWCDMTNKWWTVQSVEPYEGWKIVDGVKVPQVLIKTRRVARAAEPDQLVRAVRSSEHLAACMDDALSYQATWKATKKSTHASMSMADALRHQSTCAALEE